MPIPASVKPDPRWPAEAIAAIDRLRASAARLTNRNYWPLRMFVSSNLFLWHIDGFEEPGNPVPRFVAKVDTACALFDAAITSSLCSSAFDESGTAMIGSDGEFEKHVSGLFSDVWVGLTDDIYFDQSYNFAKERLEKNGVDPQRLFAGKTVVDAGCGSGKFSAAIARFGAAKVIGLDIGEKGIQFARQQAKKVTYGDRLDYRNASLLDIPLEDASVDMVWSNGVIHHTLNYAKCLSEFARITKPGGMMFLYVNGRFGLWELLMDAIKDVTRPVPRSLFQHFLVLMGMDSGRIYWMMDNLYAPYEWKSREEVEALVKAAGFKDIVQLKRGVSIDQIEMVSSGTPFADIKYGDAQLKFLAVRA